MTTRGTDTAQDAPVMRETLIDRPSGSVQNHATITVRPDTQLTHYVIVSDPTTSGMVDWDVTLGRQSIYELFLITPTNVSLQKTVTITLDGDQARASVRSLTLAAGHAAAHERIAVQHQAPHCRSHVLTRALVTDNATALTTGAITVGRGAVGTDAALSSRNVLLSRTARAVAEPQFSIQTDDVGCKHDALTAPLDANAITYLRSRGLTQHTAAHLLLASTAAEIWHAIPDASLRQEIGGQTAAWLTAHRYAG